MSEQWKFSDIFEESVVSTKNSDIHFYNGGEGPPVLLLHGFANTAETWIPLANSLAENHLVLVPDLPGIGRSKTQLESFNKKAIASEFFEMLQALDINESAIVGHDLGMMVAYSFASLYPSNTTELVLMEAAIAGTPAFNAMMSNPQAWHFNFHGSHAERLVQGRERIYLDRFWDEFSIDSEKITEEMRKHYADFYSNHDSMKNAFNYFKDFTQDLEDNKDLVTRSLEMPLLCMGGEASLGPMLEMVVGGIHQAPQTKSVSKSCHWLLEENPEEVCEIVNSFLNKGEK